MLRKNATLAQTINSPFMTQPKRIPTFPNVDRTAVIDFSLPGEISMPAIPYQQRVLLTRQPVYPLWVQRMVTNPLGYAVGYLPTAYDSSVARYKMPAFSQMLSKENVGSDAIWESDNPISVGRPKYYTTIAADLDTSYTAPILGFDTKLDNAPFFYVPVGALLTLSAIFPSVAGTAVSYWVLTYEKHNTAGEVIQLSHTFLAGDGTSTVIYADLSGVNGWIRPTGFAKRDGPFVSNSMPVVWFFITPGAPALTLAYGTTYYPSVEVTAVTGDATLPAPFSTDFWVSNAPWSSTRVTAAALNIQNVTKAMDQEGLIMCGRINPATHNPYTVTAATLASFHPLEKVQLPMQMGVYTFTVPSSEAEKYADYVLPVTFNRGTTANQNLVVGVPAMDLSSSAYWNAMILNDQDGGSKFSYVLDWHIEFRTTSTLWIIDIARETLESYHKAVVGLYTKPFFTKARDLGALQAPRTRLSPAVIPRSGKSNGKKKEKARPPPRGAKAQKAQVVIHANMPKPKPSGKPKLASGLDLYLASRKK